MTITKEDIPPHIDLDRLNETIEKIKNRTINKGKENRGQGLTLAYRYMMLEQSRLAERGSSFLYVGHNYDLAKQQLVEVAALLEAESGNNIVNVNLSSLYIRYTRERDRKNTALFEYDRYLQFRFISVETLLKNSGGCVRGIRTKQVYTDYDPFNRFNSKDFRRLTDVYYYLESIGTEIL